jgi:hypothetical protein
MIKAQQRSQSQHITSVRPTAPPARLDSTRHVTPTPSARRGKRARARAARLSPLFNFTRGVPKGYLISWMGDSQIHIRYFSLFPSIKHMGFNSFINTINSLRPIYSNNPHQEFQATLEMLLSSLLFLIYQYYNGDC